MSTTSASASEDRLIDALISCDCICHTRALVQIGITNADEVLVFSRFSRGPHMMANAAKIPLSDATLIIDSITKSLASYVHSSALKQEPDDDSDIEIISVNIPSTAPIAASENAQHKHDASSQSVQNSIITLHNTQSPQLHSNNRNALIGVVPEVHNNVHFMDSLQYNGYEQNEQRNTAHSFPISPPSSSPFAISVAMSPIQQSMVVKQESNELGMDPTEDTQNAVSIAVNIENNTQSTADRERMDDIDPSQQSHVSVNIIDHTKIVSLGPIRDHHNILSESESETESDLSIVCYRCYRQFNSVSAKRRHICSDDDFSLSESPTPPTSTTTSTLTPPSKSYICADCSKEFKNGKALGGHRSRSLKCGKKKKNNADELKQDRFEATTDDDSDTFTIIKRVKTRKKRKYIPKFRNKDGSQRAPRLSLEDALRDKESKQYWSDARKRAWKNRNKHPEQYYYRFNHEGEGTRNGPWSQQEHVLFIDRMKEFGVNEKWGVFSQSIPGRVGYICSNYYRKLIKRNTVSDFNYYKDANGKLRFKWGKSSGLHTAEELRICKKFCFQILSSDGEIMFKHPRFSEGFEYMERKYEKQLDKTYTKFKSNDDRHNLEPSRKKRRIK